MTARHQVRVGGRVARGRTPIDATPAPSLGEVLQITRQGKGVDLQRAERDTKIRYKHLVALESDDYAALPGNVYARGFLRNYALYLGLDPEEMLLKWHHVQDLRHQASQEAIVAPPQPITEPKGSLRFTRAVFAVALLSVVIIAFVGYVGLQVVRFSQVPAVAFDGPPRRELPADAQTARLTGTSAAGFTVVVSGPGDFLRTVQAGADTTWSIDVPVTKGQNDFTILARDPTTNRESPPVNVIVMVPVPASPTPVAPAVTPATSAGIPIPAAHLTLTEPKEGARVSSSTVKVSGTTEAAGVTISAVYVGPLGRAAPTPAPATPSAVQVGVSAGTFSGSLSLPVGRWTITATTSASNTLVSTSQTASVDVSYGGIQLVVAARGGAARIRVWVDGVIAETGRTLRKGQTETFTARQTIVVSTADASATAYRFNGVAIGTPGKAGGVERWQFDKGRAKPHRIH